MNNDKLPIFSIFFEAIVLPYKQYRLLLKVGLPLIISWFLFFAFFISLTIAPPLYSSLPLVIPICLTIVFLISLLMAIIGCHRIFLMAPNVVQDTKLFHWTGNEVKYIGWLIYISICIGLIALPFTGIFLPKIISLIDGFIQNKVILFIILSLIILPIHYLLSRFSLALPSCAIDRHGNSLLWFWNLSEGNGWRLTLLIGIVPFFMSTVFDFLAVHDSIIFSLFSLALWFVAGVIEIGLLSLSYAYLSAEERNLNLEC